MRFAMDKIIRATAADGQIKMAVITARDTVERARQIHGCSPVAAAALGLQQRILRQLALHPAASAADKRHLRLAAVVPGDDVLHSDFGLLADAEDAAHALGFHVHILLAPL